MKATTKLFGLLLLSVLLAGCNRNQHWSNLDKEAFRHYIEKFNNDDTLNLHENVIEATRMIVNDQSWPFLKENIPFFNCPDPEIEEVYYYRWWTFRKHIKQTDEGYVISEFMPRVPWAGKHNTISCPAGHHIREGRWLHDPVIIRDYIRFWLQGGGNPQTYSFWLAESLLQYHKVHPDESLLIELLPELIENYRQWESRRKDSTGLFWQYDGQDGMEVAIGGTGIRPTINTYMFADAVAISAIAGFKGAIETQNLFRDAAGFIREETLNRLWDDEAGFFKVLPYLNIQGQRILSDSLSSARELLGYVPWYLELVPPEQGYEVAWKHLMDPEGFYAPFGPTTAEQRHPGFRINYFGHECQWNGPSWPFATSQTLTALSNVLWKYPQEIIDKDDYLMVLKNYTASHRFRQIPPDGDTITSDLLWIDENLNPFNGDWLARTRMEVQGYSHVFRERGIYYNHSTYADLIIEGLVGIKPTMENELIVSPLIPDNWDWFCLDDVRYKNHIISIVWDRTGQKYKLGKGMRIMVDGRLRVKSKRLKPVQIDL